MKLRKTDAQGTIHELPIQLANIAEFDNINPRSTKEKNDYIKILDNHKIFPSGATRAKKIEIVSKLKVMNFDESEIIEQKEILKSINSINRLITKTRKNLEDEVRSGKNVKKNMLILSNVDKIEVNIPRNIRNDLKIYDKAIRLKKFSSVATKNRINYYSGLNYDFLIKDGFSRPYYIDYEKLQKIRRDGNIVELLLKNFENSLNQSFEKDKSALAGYDKKKWLAKQKVYDKIRKVLEHNKEIATNKKYNKKLITRNKDGKISKENSEYPVLMDILHEMIELFIP